MSPFAVYRKLLGIAVITYTLMQILRSLLLWRRQLTGPDRYRRLARRYVEISLLTISIRRHWVALMQIFLLVATLVALIALHP